MASAAPLPQGRLLVIDEDPVVRVALRHLLEEKGYEVVAASDCATLPKGIDLAFDGVLLDVQDLDEDCLPLLRTIRALPIDAPILLLADYGAVLPSGLEPDYGTVDLLTKPFKADRLEQRVRGLIGRG